MLLRLDGGFVHDGRSLEEEAVQFDLATVALRLAVMDNNQIVSPLWPRRRGSLRAPNGSDLTFNLGVPGAGSLPRFVSISLRRNLITLELCIALDGQWTRQ